MTRPTVALLLGLAAATLGLAPAAAAEDPFYLSPGDRISVTVFEQPDLSGSYLVEPNGDVSLPLIGPLNVTSSTSHDLQDEITARLKNGFLQNPVVNVRLTDLQPVTIVGDIRGPGRYTFVVGMTVEAALALAGGVRVSSEEAAQRLELLRTKERLGTLTRARLSQRVRKARLEAQASDKADFDVAAADGGDADLLKRLVEGERQILGFERRTLQSQIVSATERRRVLESDIRSSTEQTDFQREQIGVLDRELSDVTGLLINGLTRKSPVLDLQREKSKAQADLSRVLGDLVRSRSNLAEIDRTIQDLGTAYHSRVASDLQSVGLQLEETESALPLVREDLRMRMEQLPWAAKNDDSSVIRISRYRKGKSETFPAEAGALLRPGDIIQVGSGLGAGTAPASGASWQPRTDAADIGASQPPAVGAATGALSSGADQLSQR